MSKGSKRRRENTALVEANWEAIFGPARSPIPDSPMAEAQGQAASEGATMPVLPDAGQDHGSNDC